MATATSSSSSDKPTLSFTRDPLSDEGLNSPERRLASWSARISVHGLAEGSSSSPWVGEDNNMTPLPSPGTSSQDWPGSGSRLSPTRPPPVPRDWGAFPVGTSDNVANRGRSSSVFEEMRVVQQQQPPPLISPALSKGSVSSRSKTHSFFDLDAAAGDHTSSPTPPPNPPSRGNSLRKPGADSSLSSSTNGSWLDRLDAQSSWRYGTMPRAGGVIDGLPPSGVTSSSVVFPSDEFGQVSKVTTRDSGSEQQVHDTTSESVRHASNKPALPALQTTQLRVRTRVLSTSTPTSRPMTALPTPVDEMARVKLPARPPPIDLTGTSSTLSPGMGPVSPLTPSMDDPPPLRLSLEDDAPVAGDMIGEYRIERLLGKGAFSRVALGKRPSQPGLVALKLIAVKSYDGNERMRVSVVREVDVLRNIRHPSLVSLLASFSTPLYTVLVLDYAPGGELFDFLGEWHSQVEEPLARRIFGELCDAVGWMHSIGLVHRDIKLENILLTSRPFPTTSSSSVMSSLPTPFVKLTDFGLSRFVNPADPTLTTRCGSEAYAAPELIMGKKYDGRQTDAWALGVVLFALVTGVMPFIEGGEAKGRRVYLLKIAKGEYRWPGGRLVTPTVQQLVARLLVRDPGRRARVEEVWDEEWMRGEGRAVRVQGHMAGEDAAMEQRVAWARRGSELSPGGE